MRLPWVQVTQEAFGLARALGGVLGCDRHRALSLLLDLWAWGLDQGPEDEPPMGIVASPRAARMLAGAVEWPGDADALVEALEDLGTVEVLQHGLRVRGMKRYHATWRKNRGIAAPEPTGGRARQGRPPSGTRAEPERDTKRQTQTQTHTQRNRSAAAARESEAGPDPTDPDLPLVAAFVATVPDILPARVPLPVPEAELFAWCQEQRLVALPGAMPEQRPPPGWVSWYREALAAVGGDEGRLRAAWVAWLDDEWGRTRKPPCPSRAFVAPEVWRKHVPGQGGAKSKRATDGAGGPRARAPCAVCGEATEGGAWGQSLCAVHWAELMEQQVRSNAAAAQWVASHTEGRAAQ